jgi:hypothetical protein
MSPRLNKPVIIFLLGAWCLSSCTKEYAYFKDHSPASCCRIDSVAVTLNSISPIVQRFHFTYNAAGRPTLIAAQVPAAYNYQDYIFRYDNHGRLKDYLFTDGGGGTYVYFWDRFTYPAPHTIIDSTYDYQGSTSDPNPIYPANITSVRIITQDAQGRTTRIIHRSPFASPDTTYTHYDAQGDAVITGVTYDDKVNWYQLSPTWQLVFNDYSIHNPFVPATVVFPASMTAYDAFGLPTVFEERVVQPGAPGAHLMVFYYSSMQVYYSCDQNGTAPPHGSL